MKNYLLGKDCLYRPIETSTVLRCSCSGYTMARLVGYKIFSPIKVEACYKCDSCGAFHLALGDKTMGVSSSIAERFLKEADKAT